MLLLFLLLLHKEKSIAKTSSMFQRQKFFSKVERADMSKKLKNNDTSSSNTTETTQTVETKTNFIPTIAILSLMFCIIILFVGFVLFYCKRMKNEEKETTDDCTKSDNPVLINLIA